MRVIAMAHLACDEGQFDVARDLLWIGEALIVGREEPRLRQREMAVLIAAHERLWQLSRAAAGPDIGPLPG